MFTGANVANVTKIKQSDVLLKIIGTVVGMVIVPATLAEGEAVPLATLLSSTDGGITWNTQTTPAFDDTAIYAVDNEVYFKGHTWKSTAADNTTVPDVGDWDDLGIWDANGILFNDITQSKKTTVVVTGDIKQKYLHGFDEFLRAQLFKNKLLVK